MGGLASGRSICNFSRRSGVSRFSRMKLPCLAVALSIGMPAAGWAADNAASVVPEAKPAKRNEVVFSLWPKSLQRNPRMDFNIITEMTPAGRKAKQPTAEAPVYYIAQGGKMINNGVGAEGLKGPPPEKLQSLMDRALTSAGYLPGDGKTHLPTLAVVYNWGSSSFQPPSDVSDENGEGNVPVPEVVLRKALLDRARLLGGEKFFVEVARAMEQIDQKASATRSFVAPEGADFMGSVGDMMPDPFDQLRTRNPEMDRLVDELFSSSFFVVASAYDYQALAKGQRVLLWRTKMTVNSLGVNMEESVPPLIASAAPYLGKETPDPVLVTKRISRDGKVEIGTPVVVPDGAPGAPAKK